MPGAQMTRILLFLLFFVLLMADMFRLDLSLAPGLSVKNAFLYLVFLGIAIETALARNRELELPSVIVTYGLFVLYAAFSYLIVVLVIDYPAYGIFGSAIRLKAGPVENLLVLLVFFYGVLITRDAVWMLKAMIWSVLLANTISVADTLWLDMGLTPAREDGRIGGPIGESNQYAAFLAMYIPGAVALAAVSAGWRRTLALVGVGVSGIALLMTASRGGLVGGAIGAVLALFFLRRFVSGKAVMAYASGFFVLGIIVLAVIYATDYAHLFQARVVDASAQQSTHDLSSGRSYIWGAALARMMDSPVSLVTGFGWNTYRVFSVTGFAPHNSYLDIFFDLGIIGLTLVLLTFANVMRVARIGLSHAGPESSPLLFAFIFGLFCMLVAIFFVDLSPMPWLFIWAYTGVALRLSVSRVALASATESREEDPSVSGGPLAARPG
jgi:O-antigen ligase